LTTKLAAETNPMRAAVIAVVMVVASSAQIPISGRQQVPGPAAADPWETSDVPHGIVHRHIYRSPIGSDTRDLYVYTPPGYDASAGHRYPVLYLLHGFSDDASAWQSMGMANLILDNLIARGAAQPMLLVMPLGYGIPGILNAAERTPGMGAKSQERFGEMMFSEIIPLVERSYRVDADRRGRAIAGLSMGGSEALTIGLNHLDMFGAVGGFSSGLRDEFEHQFPNLSSQANDMLRPLWIACGTSDRLIDINRKFKAWLASKQIRLTGVETEGGHTWEVWRRNLAAFAPLLFQSPHS
jgi:enterochelin esterase-like enzyme